MHAMVCAAWLGWFGGGGGGWQCTMHMHADAVLEPVSKHMHTCMAHAVARRARMAHALARRARNGAHALT